MTRKSFDLEDDELNDARRRATEAGVSLNHYIRLAVVEKNARQAAASELIQLASEAQAAVATIAVLGEQIRVQLVGDADQVLAAIERQQGAFIEKQQALLTQFLLTLGAQLQGRGMPSAGTSPKPIAPWDDPLGPSIPNK